MAKKDRLIKSSKNDYRSHYTQYLYLFGIWGCFKAEDKKRRNSERGKLKLRPQDGHRSNVPKEVKLQAAETAG